MSASTQDEIAALDRIGSRVALTKEDALEAVRDRPTGIVLAWSTQHYLETTSIVLLGLACQWPRSGAIASSSWSPLVLADPP